VPVLPDDARLIMYHKQATSARTRFLRLADCGVVGFADFPDLSVVLEPEECPEDAVLQHPGAFLREAEHFLGLERGALEVEVCYRERVDVPGSTVNVYLAAFTAIDPPFEAAERVSGRFCALTEMRDLSPVQLELLRRAYQVIMEG